mmetsp:Transcript_8838/g.16060  ORF Transcript_8838/g.16060 Transcript_8838/m.16060 type:complete len:265 (+) Transcript_8838:55-849(+)
MMHLLILSFTLSRASSKLQPRTSTVLESIRIAGPFIRVASCCSPAEDFWFVSAINAILVDLEIREDFLSPLLELGGLVFDLDIAGPAGTMERSVVLSVMDNPVTSTCNCLPRSFTTVASLPNIAPDLQTVRVSPSFNGGRFLISAKGTSSCFASSTAAAAFFFALSTLGTFSASLIASRFTNLMSSQLLAISFREGSDFSLLKTSSRIFSFSSSFLANLLASSRRAVSIFFSNLLRSSFILISIAAISCLRFSISRTCSSINAF